MHPLLRGALAGTLATLPMSAVMLAAGRRMGTQPPEAITRSAVQAVTGEQPEEPTANALSSVAHLAFGATCGVGYALLPRVGPPAVRGTVLALGVWAAAYQGWVPALGIMPPASEDHQPRPQTMVAAHVVFGSVLGYVDDRLR